MQINVADIKFQSKSKKAPEFDWISFILIIVAIGIIIAAVYFIFYFKESKILQIIEKGENISGIIVENNGERTDAVFLSFYNPKTEKLAFIMIPGNTRLKVEYEKAPEYDTVSNMYKKGNALVVKNTMEKLTGHKFTFYMVYGLKTVESFIDLLEGVYVNMEKSIDYIDVKNSTFIRIPSGENLLDGAKVKELLMYQYGENGLKAKLENHRIVAESILDRKRDVIELSENNAVVRLLMKQVDTNLSKKDIKVLVSRINKLNSSRLLFYKMFGRSMKIKGTVYLLPINNGGWLTDRIKELNKFLNDEGPAPIGDDIKIEILNGSSNPGQAQNLRNYFIKYGFNVVHFGNALRNDYEKTVVIDRVGKPILAKRIADIINCKEVYTKIDKSLLVDITIIIGNDFEGRYVR